MFGWTEVYLCTEQKTFFEKQDILAQHRIRFKTKGTDSGATLGRTNLGGEFPLLGRSGLTGVMSNAKTPNRQSTCSASR